MHRIMHHSVASNKNVTLDIRPIKYLHRKVGGKQLITFKVPHILYLATVQLKLCSSWLFVTSHRTLTKTALETFYIKAPNAAEVPIKIKGSSNIRVQIHPFLCRSRQITALLVHTSDFCRGMQKSYKK